MQLKLQRSTFVLKLKKLRSEYYVVISLNFWSAVFSQNLLIEFKSVIQKRVCVGGGLTFDNLKAVVFDNSISDTQISVIINLFFVNH